MVRVTRSTLPARRKRDAGLQTTYKTCPYVRFQRSKGNRTVAQSYQTRHECVSACCFFAVSPSCRSCTGPTTHRPARSRGCRKFFGRSRSVAADPRPEAGLLVVVTARGAAGKLVWRPIQITNESPLTDVRCVASRLRQPSSPSPDSRHRCPLESRRRVEPFHTERKDDRRARRRPDPLR